MLRLLIILLGLTLILSGCSSNKKDPYIGLSAPYIYATGHNNLSSDDYNDAIIAFESLNSQYPFSKYSKKGDLEIIYAYYLADQQALALASAQRYLKLYPNSDNAAYAYCMIGVIDFNNGRGFLQRYFPYQMDKHNANNYVNAFNNFNIVITQYPKSHYAKDARRRMLYLLNTMARYNLLIGQYYYDRGAYVATAQRAREVLLKYPTSSETEKALELTIRAYKKLKLYRLAYINNQVLKLNFPNNTLALNLPKGAMLNFTKSEAASVPRSEERRVGKECRSRWSPYH